MWPIAAACLYSRHDSARTKIKSDPPLPSFLEKTAAISGIEVLAAGIGLCFLTPRIRSAAFRPATARPIDRVSDLRVEAKGWTGVP